MIELFRVAMRRWLGLDRLERELDSFKMSRLEERVQHTRQLDALALDVIAMKTTATAFPVPKPSDHAAESADDYEPAMGRN